jgi:hypothetical protein
MASGGNDADPVGGELARVMRTVTWFLIFPLTLRLANLMQGKPLPTRLDGLELTVWLVTAAAFYLGFRGRPRDPHSWAAAAAFTVFATIAFGRVGLAPQALALVPFVVAVLAVLLGPTPPVARTEGHGGADPGHPLATVALLESHAAELHAQGRVAEAAKLRERAHKIRVKAGNG